MLQINAAIDAMDNDDTDRASDYFVDALILIGSNQKVSNLIKSNLPKKIISKINKKHGCCLDWNVLTIVGFQFFNNIKWMICF